MQLKTVYTSTSELGHLLIQGSQLGPNGVLYREDPLYTGQPAASQRCPLYTGFFVCTCVLIGYIVCSGSGKKGMCPELL